MSHLASGHKAVPLEGEELARQMKDWKGYPKGLVRLEPGGWVFPSAYTLFADRLYNYKFKSTDVVLMTYPKCGTTWMQEIAWTMRNNPDLDPTVAAIPLFSRSTYIDMDMVMADHPFMNDPKNPVLEVFHKSCPGQFFKDGLMMQLTDKLPDPRTIKTHLPLSLLSPTLLDNCKVIYLARNPKDVIISYFHHCRTTKMQDFVGTLETYVQYFVDDDLMYSPYWLHLKEAWEKRDQPNLHIAFYEDLKADIKGELKRLDAFLGTKLTEVQIEGIIKHTSFKEMKARDTIAAKAKDDEELMNVDAVEEEGAGFYRKGETGDWKNRFTPEMSAKVDKWIEKNLGSLGINFKYTL